MIGRERVMEWVIVYVYLCKISLIITSTGVCRTVLHEKVDSANLSTCARACVHVWGEGGTRARARFTYATLFAHSYMHVSDVDTLVYVYYT